MNFTNFTRTCTALVAGSALFAAVSAGAQAQTFDVTTTVATACTVTDSGPGNLAPTYDQPSNTGTGAETVLNTFCNGETPTVGFADEFGTGTQFVMLSGGNELYFQLSNTATCTGIAGDNPFIEYAANALTPGPSGFDICAAVTVTNGVNTGAPAGTYTDTVYFTVTP